MDSRYLKLSNENSYILLGPRQTGKTYLIRSLQASNSWMVNLLHRKTYLKYLKAPGLFRDEAEHQVKNQGVQIIYIDEIQKIPDLLDEVHAMIEEWGIRFVLTGSSARKLKRGSANLLAGRAISKRMYPLIYPEIQSDFEQKKIELDGVLQFGTLPGVFFKPPKSRPEILRTYVETYLKEEIQSEGLVRRLENFANFLDVAAQSFGEVVNYSKIGKDCQQSPRTTQNYFEILEDTLVGYLLRPWSQSQRKQLSTHPKFYFFDNGVTCALLSRLVDPLDPPLRGRLFEQWLINEVRARTDYDQRDVTLTFWRTQDGKEEVDLIASRGSTPLFAAEIKSFATLHADHFKSLQSFREEFPQLPLYLIYTGDQPYNKDSIQVVPWRYFLEKVVTRY